MQLSSVLMLDLIFSKICTNGKEKKKFLFVVFVVGLEKISF
jgi:hypothetical protein